jgi:hypothetical protein
LNTKSTFAPEGWMTVALSWESAISPPPKQAQ